MQRTSLASSLAISTMLCGIGAMGGMSRAATGVDEYAHVTDYIKRTRQPALLNLPVDIGSGRLRRKKKTPSKAARRAMVRPPR